MRGVGRLDGDEGFAEVFLDDVFVPDDRRARRASNEGWSVAMATTGSERGLTLRSPGRFLADGATGSIDLCATRAATPSDPALRDRVVAGVDRRRGLPAADALDRHPHRSKASRRAPSRA